MKAETAFSVQGNPFVVTKSSNIPGKAITETPGLIVGNPKMVVRKLAVGMTLTESEIELAGATRGRRAGASSLRLLKRQAAEVCRCAATSTFTIWPSSRPTRPFTADTRASGSWRGHVPFKTYIAYGGVPGNMVALTGKPLCRKSRRHKTS